MRQERKPEIKAFLKAALKARYPHGLDSGIEPTEFWPGHAAGTTSSEMLTDQADELPPEIIEAFCDCRRSRGSK
jgi:hypothetical protein